MNKLQIVYSLLVVLFPLFLFGQVEKESDLFISLKEQDSIFFERGFNRCDMEYLKEHISKDLKFYHDQGGVQDYDGFFEASRNNICSNPDRKPIRKLVSGSLEVFPLYNNGKLYGAIQHGVHRFYIREPNKEDVGTSIAQFTHVWLLENESWKLTEVLSYDHKATPSDN